MTARAFKSRSRSSNRPISAQEAQRLADELFANAETMPQGAARQTVIEKARTFRWLAEIRRIVTAGQGGR
jgi:hypothetical protein